MKRSKRLYKTAAMAFALALMASACSKFAAQSDVSIKQVPIDLTFGFKPQVLPTQFVAPPELGGDVLILDPPKPLPPLPEGPKSLCPPGKSLSAEDAPAAIRNGAQPSGNEPKEGTYLFRFIGNEENKPQFDAVGYKTISSPQLEGDGFLYRIEYDYPPGLEITYESHPTESEDNAPPKGLFLRSILIPVALKPAKGEQEPNTLQFVPTPPLRLLDYTIQPGAETRSTAPDTALKGDEKIPDPTGGFVPTPGRSEMVSTTLVGTRETLDVCEELVRGWKVNWQLEITGGYNVTISGAFWLATQYGGWPVRGDYIIDGDLINGNFFDNLMRIDPGDYI